MPKKRKIPLALQTRNAICRQESDKKFKNQIRKLEKDYASLRRISTRHTTQLIARINELDLCLQKSQLACQAMIKLHPKLNVIHYKITNQ